MIRRLLALFNRRGGTMPPSTPAADEQVVQLSPGSGPPIPEVAPPRQPPAYGLSVDERVRRYRALRPPRKSDGRRQDDESLFWRLYDEG